MKCPVCENVDLVMTERQGVEIDYCPKCRGVWLDRGELDKILERSAELEQRPSSATTQGSYAADPHKRKNDDYYPDKDYYDDDDYRRHPHKKKHWLGEVFDIFD